MNDLLFSPPLAGRRPPVNGSSSTVSSGPFNTTAGSSSGIHQSRSMQRTATGSGARESGVGRGAARARGCNRRGAPFVTGSRRAGGGPSTSFSPFSGSRSSFVREHRHRRNCLNNQFQHNLINTGSPSRDQPRPLAVQMAHHHPQLSSPLHQSTAHSRIHQRVRTVNMPSNLPSYFPRAHRERVDRFLASEFVPFLLQFHIICLIIN